MKIGPLDIGIKTLALAAGIVVVAMLDLRLVFISFLVTFTGKWEERSAKLPRLLGGRRSKKRRIAPLAKPPCEAPVARG